MFSPFCVNLRAFTSKIENIDKRLTHLLPTLHNIFYFCSIFLKEEEVHVGCELRHGAQHKGDGGQDHHGQRQEGVDLGNKRLFSSFFYSILPGLPRMFPGILSSSRDIFSGAHTCCHRNPLPSDVPHIFVGTDSQIQFPGGF